MKAIVFDSGTLISLAMSGLYPELRKLKGVFDGKFLITAEVKKEIVDKPIKIKRFEFEAMKVKQLMDDKIIEMPSSVGIKDGELKAQTNSFVEAANNIYSDRKKNIEVIHSGEASCLALSKLLTERGIKNVIAIDERTTRMLSEKPENLQKLLERRLHRKIQLKKENFAPFKGFRFIRSAELMYVAYKKGLVRVKDKNVLDGLLYAVKFKGCAITGDEIKEIERIK
jgi:hypothetical protein